MDPQLSVYELAVQRLESAHRVITRSHKAVERSQRIIRRTRVINVESQLRLRKRVVTSGQWLVAS